MTNITTLRPGEHFMFKNFEWVCLDPNHPDGGVLAIMAKPWAKDVKFCPSDKFADERGNWNNYRTSNVRGVLSDMANAVFAGKGLLPHMPSCRMCNHYKRAHDLETFRRYIAEIPRKLQENYIYKVGVVYGNVLENPKAIKFYFEKVRDSHATD